MESILAHVRNQVDQVIREVRASLSRHDIAGPGIVAVSGGPDSVALLRILHTLGAGPLTVAHVNHQLRGPDSDADAHFVQTLAEQLGLPCAIVNRDIPAIIASTGENLEAAARRCRYDWLRERAGSTHWIATGHTADDQAETILHRMIRGTGLQGLRGILPTHGDDENAPQSPWRVVRPLLGVRRQDLLAYLESLGQSYRVDASNTDERFTRNRIRHELLPLLSTFNPDVVGVLNRLAEQAQELFAERAVETRTLLEQVERPRAGNTLVFDRTRLQTLAPSRVRDLFRHVWFREGWPANAMTYPHWQRLARLTVGDYPGGVRLQVQGPVVQLVGPRTEPAPQKRSSD